MLLKDLLRGASAGEVGEAGDLSWKMAILFVLLTWFRNLDIVQPCLSRFDQRVI